MQNLVKEGQEGSRGLRFLILGPPPISGTVEARNFYNSDKVLASDVAVILRN